MAQFFLKKSVFFFFYWGCFERGRALPSWCFQLRPVWLPTWGERLNSKAMISLCLLFLFTFVIKTVNNVKYEDSSSRGCTSRTAPQERLSGKESVILFLQSLCHFHSVCFALTFPLASNDGGVLVRGCDSCQQVPLVSERGAQNTTMQRRGGPSFEFNTC